jgi:hypothetical protein
MVFRKNSSESERKAPLENLTIILEPVQLPEAEEKERIKRLSKQILDCIERARRDRKRVKKEREDDPFSKNFDAIFGLDALPA